MNRKNFNPSSEWNLSRRHLLSILGATAVLVLAFNDEIKNQEISGLDKIANMNHRLYLLAEDWRQAEDIDSESEIIDWLKNNAKVDVVRAASGEKLELAAKNSGISINASLVDIINSSAGSLLFNHDKGWDDQVSVADASMTVGAMTVLVNQSSIDRQSVGQILDMIGEDPRGGADVRDLIFANCVEALSSAIERDPKRPVNYIYDKG